VYRSTCAVAPVSVPASQKAGVIQVSVPASQNVSKSQPAQSCDDYDRDVTEAALCIALTACAPHASRR
jgi:hypothetical protein